MANQIVGNAHLLNDTFKPFQSSGGVVHSCNNYYSMVQKGGNKNEDFDKNNFGIGYETSFGGSTKSKSKSTSSTKSKSILNKVMNKLRKTKKNILSKLSKKDKIKPIT